MQIIIADRPTLESGLSVKAGTYAVISIRDPDQPEVRLPRTPGLRATLRLAFHDAEPVGSSVLPDEIRLMSEADARQIVEFVWEHRDRVNALVVHCEQGMSRSPAVGLAIAEALDLDKSALCGDCHPNPYVHRLVAGAFKDHGAQTPKEPSEFHKRLQHDGLQLVKRADRNQAEDQPGTTPSGNP